MLPVVITMLFLMSMHANEARRILLGEQELMNKNFLLESPKGRVLPFASNPDYYKPASTISQRAFKGHNVASLHGLLQKGLVPPSTPNPITHNHRSTISQRAFVSHNLASLQGLL